MKKQQSTNNVNLTYLKEKCSMLHAMEQINGRWKIIILWYIKLGANRFSKLKQSIPPITTKMLSQELNELEQDGLITRIVKEQRPLKVEYFFTEKAISLIPILELLNQWGEKQKQNEMAAITHNQQQNEIK